MAAVVCAAGRADASPLLELLGGTGGGGGFNARVAGGGAEVTYFNPALLPHVPDGFDTSFIGLATDLTIETRARPAGIDVAPSIRNAWLPDGMGSVSPLELRPLPTGDLPERQGEGAGGDAQALIELGIVRRLLGDRLVLGFHAILPAGGIQAASTHYVDEREQYFSNGLHFELLGDRLTMSTFALAIGGQITPCLSAGAGLGASIEIATTTPVYVPDGADYGTILLDTDMSVDTPIAPHLGLLWTPHRRLRVAATLHTSTSVEIDGTNDIQVGNSSPATQEFHFTQGWQPLTIAGAALFTAIDGRRASLDVVASAVWRQWSEYRDRHGERPLDDWSDTVSAAAGARLRGPRWVTHLDAVWAPSPVPEQDGRTNYVDADRVAVSAGGDLELALGGVRARVGLELQAHRLLSRSATKRADAAHPVIDEFPDEAVLATDPDTPIPEAAGLQTNNPGYPGWSSEGWIFAAGVTLHVDF